MTVECPLCGERASNSVSIQPGDSWVDSFGKPPHSFFDSHVMLHAQTNANGDRVIYVHTKRDLQSGPF